MTWSSSCSFVVLGLGSDEASGEALLHHLSVIVEEEESPYADIDAAHDLTDRKIRKDEVPEEWLKESFHGGLDECSWHYYF